jgi:peptidoglycan LD-endopeptidase LytH
MKSYAGKRQEFAERKFVTTGKAFLIYLMNGSLGVVLMACVIERTDRDVLRNAPSPTVSPLPTAIMIPSPSPSPPSLSPSPALAATPALTATFLSLVIPVVGVRHDQLHDTFNESRSEGRVHEAIDIIAPQGSRVVAATDGTIARLFTSEKGGLTIYQLSADQQWVFYYAHLDRYAEGLTEKQAVRQGEIIGYVGDTGNAQPGNYHLHFAVWQITDPKDFWKGTNMNPYDMLRHAPMSR